MTITGASHRPALDPNEFRDELYAVYADVDAAVAELKPVCELSGRCCRFAEYGHTLFVSAPEFALLLADAPAPVRPIDGGATCPWQDARGRCTARGARPLGCRVYFCDPDYQAHLPAVSEEFISRLKLLIDAYGLPWHYAPLHHHLHEAVEEGRFFPPESLQPATEPAGTATVPWILA
jgi:Fe-S-cluster containining protein